MEKEKKEGIINELVINTSRSGGAGGQNVNKVSTKVELRLNLANSSYLTEEEKERINHKYKNRITAEGELIVTCQETRSQLKNRELCQIKLFEMIQNALQVRKSRKKSKPSRTAIEKRLQEKKKHSQKKDFRRRNF